MMFQDLVRDLVWKAPLLHAPPPTSSRNNNNDDDDEQTQQKQQRGVKEEQEEEMVERWQQVIVGLVRKVCAVVDPDVRRQGDLLDIRQVSSFIR